MSRVHTPNRTMTVIDSTRRRSADRNDGDGSLELLTNDEGMWTIVPTDAAGDRRMTEWVSVDHETLCELEEWE